MNCLGCEAKDREIERLHGLVRELVVPKVVSPPMEPEPDPLPDDVEIFLDGFGRGSSLWRQQSSEARKLRRRGEDPESIIAILSTGQEVEL